MLHLVVDAAEVFAEHADGDELHAAEEQHERGERRETRRRPLDVDEAFHRLPERNRFFPGLRAWIGFPSADVPYDRQERAAGQPQQTFRRLVRYALDGLFSFSYLPLRVLTYTGIFVGTIGFCLGLYYVVKRLIAIETAPTGFTTLAALVLFLGGVQLIAIGVLGEYLGRIYDEVKQRPIYLVKPPPSAGQQKA